MKHQKVRVSKYYKIENGKVIRLKRTCPRCGDGVFMASHKEKDGKIRYFCGKCKMTIWEEA
ncbi:MAG: 30S ribosomal protein S27ae [Candidatus Aenigmarchaeota archaeon ex4484_224]|nr:MAG: 30S ribosomal protein S27ae [Candidatus Aenigmarchaeota archaeon ex4484_224]